MSRYYDILKEVSRSQPLPNAPPPSKSAEEFENELGVNHSVWDSPENTVYPASEPPHRPEPDIEMGRPPVFEKDTHEILFESLAPRAFNGGKKAAVILDRKEVLIPNAMDDAVVERYRRLRTKILQQHAIKPIKSLLVASPGPGEGKTVTTLNLAWSFGLLPLYKVLVIDGDLRKGTIGETLGVDGGLGLRDVIEGKARLEDVVLSADEAPFQFMLSGASKTPAAELLTSPRLRSIIVEMTQYFDLVLVDSPPVTLMSDAQTLAASCDGVLLVARAFATTNKAFEKALQDLQPFRIIGTILNAAVRQQGRSS
jgi:capsular exopolysaccharide synthesis family protein